MTTLTLKSKELVASQILDHKTPTQDFSLFYEAWYPKVKVATIQAGFTDDDMDDLIADIFLDLYKGDLLKKFDPEKGSFCNYIWANVRIRIKARRYDLWQRSQREVIQDMQEPDEDVYPNEPAVDDPELDNAELFATISLVAHQLEALPHTTTKNLARLFNDVVEQILTTGAFNCADVARKYGCTRQAISLQIKTLASTEALQAFKAAQES